VITIHQRHRQTDGQTTCDRKTVLCTAVHRAVIIIIIIIITIMVAVNSDGIEFLDDLGRRMTQVTDDNRDKAFLYQRLSVVIQRYNAVIIGTFAHTTPEDAF